MAFERIMGLHVVDEVEYQKYRSKMEPILVSVGASFGYDFRIAEVLRSKTKEPINRVFTLEFPSKLAMDDFFSRQDYLEVAQQHLKLAVREKTVISIHETST